MAIIAIGSYKSVEEMLRQIKRIHVDKKKGSGIEQMDYNSTIQFPLVAGATLVGLYYAMEYFGKESVNYFVLAWIAVGGTTGIKTLLKIFVGAAYDDYDQDFVIDIEVKMIGFELQMTALDFPCMIVSCLSMCVYAYTKNWLYNNILAFLFCLNAL